MYYFVGVEGPPLLLPTYLAGVFLLAFGIFGIVTLITGLESLLQSVFTDRAFFSDEIALQGVQHPVR